MRKNSAQAWFLAGFLPFICLLVVAFSLNSCSWFTSVSGVSRDSKGAHSVLVTEGGSVSMLDRRTGRQIWRHQTGVTDFTPLIVNHMIYIVSQKPGGYNPDRTDMLEALSLASGELVWRWSWKEHWTPENPPIVVDGVIYLSESNLSASATYSTAPLSEYQGFVVALRASDGQQLWKVSLPGVLSPATVANGTIYVSNGEAVLALRSIDGRQLWQYRPEPNEGLSYYTQLGMQERETNVIVVQRNQVYIYLYHVEGSHSAEDLVALDIHSGRAIWRYQSHAIFRPLLLQNGVIYLANNMIPGVGVVALNAASGSVLWTYHTAVFFDLSQPVIVSNVLYLSEFAFDSKHTSDVLAQRVTDGSVLRRYIPHSGKMFGAPVVSQHALYLGIRLSAAKGQIPTAIVALDLETGMETWRSNQLQPFGGIDVVVSQGQIYAYSPWDYTPATLVVFQASNGHQLWKHPTNSYIYHVVADFN